jgi:transcriptional antiterminator RfaH
MGASSDEVYWDQAAHKPPCEAIPEDVPGQWWVAHTKPRNEKALALDLRGHGIVHYLPVHRRATRSRNTGRVTRSIVPLFTGYLFFNGTEQQRYQALTTNRIANTLEVSNQAQLVGELRQIQTALAGEADLKWSGRVRVGDWARVVAGPLFGLEGIVQHRLSRLRLVLNVRMLSQSVSVEVPYDMIERIDGPSYAQ